MANTQTVIKTELKSTPDCPPLGYHAIGRMMSKHYINLTYTMERNKFSLFSFLISICYNDNTFKYNQMVLERYRVICKAIGEIARLKSSDGVLRRLMKELIQDGYLLHTPIKGVLLVSPVFTHRRPVGKAYYTWWIENYNKARSQVELRSRILEFTGAYIKHVKERSPKHTSGVKGF